MTDRGYLTRQTAWLMKFGTSIKNPDLAAVLVEKAVDLKNQLDETTSHPDTSPLAPDVERPARSQGEGENKMTELKNRLASLGLDNAIRLRWALRDIKGKRLMLTPVDPNDLRTLIDK
jgi:hypothetical protein